MDCSDFTGGTGRPSPRRELQGPRPTPLKVSKDSHKVKKPPLAQPAANHRPPVIIYTVSPKVIHTNPSEFMSLVQRLTGSSSSSNPSHQAPSRSGGSVLPASRLASIEESMVQASDGDRDQKSHNDVLNHLGIDLGASLDWSGRESSKFNGILSPVPNSLPPISSSFFAAPIVDASSSLNFLHQLSPAFHGNTGYVDNSFLVSPSNLWSTPVVPSPSNYWDLFNQLHGL